MSILHKRSLVTGSIPTTSSLEAGQLAINVPDGRLFLRKSGSASDQIISAITTNSSNSGSVSLTGSLSISGSGTVFSTVGDIIEMDADTLEMTGSFLVSGSSKFIGGVSVTGSLNAPSITGSLQGTSSWANNAITASYAHKTEGGIVGSGSSGQIAFFSGSSTITSSNTLFYDVVSGSLGLGTTTPSSFIAGYRSLVINGSIASQIDWRINENTGGQIYLDGSGFSVRSNPTYDLNFLTDYTTRLQVKTTTGNILVNTTTDAGYKLDVNGTGRFSSGLLITGSLNAPAITGSLQGTASWANNATTSSYILNAISSSFASTASYINQLNQDVVITGSSFVFNTNESGSNYLRFRRLGINLWTFDSDGIGTIMTLAGNSMALSQVVTAGNSLNITPGGNQPSLALGVTVGSQPATTLASFTSGSVTALSISGSGMIGTGSFNYLGNIVASSFTGSLFGTASWALNAVTSSYVLDAVSASFAQTASYALNGGVTQLLAGPNVTLSPINGLGQVTISSSGGGGSNFNTATGSYGSFYDTTTQTNPVANTPRSMSLNTTDITNGVSISGSTNPFNTYIKTENAGIYNIQFSAQVEKTDSGNDEILIWLRKNGIDLTDTATTITLSGNNAKAVAAWNWFVTSAANDYYQIIWLSADTGMRLLAETISATHPGIPSLIVTANRIDQFLSNTGSFSGSFSGSLFGTSSWANNAITSFFASTASYVNPLTQSVLITGSFNVSGSGQISGVSASSNALLIGAGVSSGMRFNNQYPLVINNGPYDFKLGFDSAGYYTQMYTETGLVLTGALGGNIRIVNSTFNSIYDNTGWYTSNPSHSYVAGHKGFFAFETNASTVRYNAIGSLFAGNNEDGLYFNYRTGGTTNEGFRLNANTGNVLINTTTDAGYRLDVNGTTRVRNTLSVSNPSYTNIGEFFQSGNNTTTLRGGPNSENITFGPGNAIIFNANGVEFNGTNSSYAADYVVNTGGVSGIEFRANSLFQQGDTRRGFTYTGNFTNALGNASTLSLILLNPVSAGHSSDIDGRIIDIRPSLNTSGGTTTIRGIYYNPSITGSVGLTNIAFESTSGTVKISDLAGTGSRMVVADSTGVLSTLSSLNATTQTTTTNSGSFTIYNIPTSSYDSVFMEYSAKSGSNARAGTFITTWVGTSVAFTDNSTTDIGDTTVLTFSGSLSGSNLVVTGNVATGSGWTVKSIIRAM
jgi:hypothetical protein